MASSINASTTAGVVTTADTSGVLNIQTAGTTAITVDASQNVGLGVTPSAWTSGFKAVQIGANGSFYADGTGTYWNNNWYINSSLQSKYLTTNTAQSYEQANGKHAWYIAPSGTAGNTISFTQAMTLDASGNLLVGITTNASAGKLTVQGGATDPFSGTGYRLASFHSTSAANADQPGIVLGFDTAGAGIVAARTNATGQPIAFWTYNGSAWGERARIDSSGRLLVGATSSIAPAGTIIPLGYRGREGTGGTEVNNFNIAWTGAAANLWIDTSNIGAITTVSDYRIKKNVETQTAIAIDRVMKLRPVTYETTDYGDLFKADGVQREGFIAHEVQEVIPSGAEGYKDEEGRIQNLRTDAILSVAIKAIQEQQTLITQLQADVAALKGA